MDQLRTELPRQLRIHDKNQRDSEREVFVCFSNSLYMRNVYTFADFPVVVYVFFTIEYLSRLSCLGTDSKC